MSENTHMHDGQKPLPLIRYAYSNFFSTYYYTSWDASSHMNIIINQFLLIDKEV